MVEMQDSKMNKSTDIRWDKKVGSFLISDQFLGKGEYSQVFLGCFQNNFSKKVACKVVKKSVFKEDPYILKTLERQYTMLKDISHENIVQFYDMHETSNNWYFFFEFCNQGTLEDYIHKKNGKLSEMKALLIVMEICEGFKELYKLNIMHRDLKPANVMLSDGVIKISDFSFAKVLDSSDKNEPLMHSMVGTPFYTPLQILEGKEYSSKCDVWSLGVMFYQMLFGRFPFVWKALAKNELKDGGIMKLTDLIKKNPLDYPVGAKLSKPLKTILEKTLGKEEYDRISWENLFETLKKLNYSELNNETPKFAGAVEIKNFEINEAYSKSNLNKNFKVENTSKDLSLLHNHLKDSQKLKGEENIAMDLVLAKINQKIAQAEVESKQSYHLSQKFKSPYLKEKQNSGKKKTTLLMDVICISDEEENFNDDMEFSEEFDEGNTNLRLPKFSAPKSMITKKKNLGNSELEQAIVILNEYLYFKRNIANFLDKIIQRLWQAYNIRKFNMNVHDFYQIMFCMIKYECVILESIEKILNEKNVLDLSLISDKPLIEKPEKLFDYYKKSIFYKELFEILSGDLNFRKNCYLKEIFETLKLYIEKDPKKYKQNFIEILNLDLVDDQKLLVPLCNSLKILYEVIYKEYQSKKKDKEMLILLKCVVLAFSPFDDFIWDVKKMKPLIDFEEFFKKLDNEKIQDLVEYINGKDMSLLQTKLKSKFSSFVNSKQFF